MSAENPNCQTHPFRDYVTEDDSFIDGGPLPGHDTAFQGQDNLYVRSTEARHLIDIVEDEGRFPSGGFRLRRWMKSEDGKDILHHYHVEMLPYLDRDSQTFLSDRLSKLRMRDRMERAQAIEHVLPFITVCPDLGVSFAANDEHFFTFTKEGDILANPKMDKFYRLFYDTTATPSIWRFGVKLTEIEEEGNLENDVYGMFATGAIYNTDLAEIKKLLDIRVATGTLRENNRRTTEILGSIARLDVSITQKPQS